jgi:rhodanese-related sulfurtransferase
MRLGRPDAPQLLDVRPPSQFAASDRLVASAQRCAPADLDAWSRMAPASQVVVYCTQGHEVSRRAAASLRAAGWNARALAGGFEGGEHGLDPDTSIRGWRSLRPPTIRKRPDLGVTGERPSRWVTRERPKVDRIACPWLIRRFIDPRADIFYVPADRVLEQAATLGAVPFDIPGVALSHRWERCSFDALLEAFDLRLPALDRLGAIVRGADTGRPSLTPQSGGLLALSLGLSQLHADDGRALQAGMGLYDALYAWCRNPDAETHTWQAHELQGGPS